MKYIFTKKDQFITGVPARDLSEEEFEMLPESRKKAVLESGVYKMEADKAATKETKEKDVKNA